MNPGWSISEAMTLARPPCPSAQILLAGTGTLRLEQLPGAPKPVFQHGLVRQLDLEIVKTSPGGQLFVVGTLALPFRLTAQV